MTATKNKMSQLQYIRSGHYITATLNTIFESIFILYTDTQIT